MTTITALNVRLGMDVSNFSEGANLAKAETTRVATIMRQSVPASEKYKQELDLINRAFSDAGKKSKEYAAAVEFLDKKYAPLIASNKAVTTATTETTKAVSAMAAAMAKTASATNPMTTAMAKFSAETKVATAATIESNKALRATPSTISATLSSLKTLAAAYLGWQTAVKSIKLATEFEDAKVAFETLTMSVNDGQVLFNQIREFDLKTPITFSNSVQAARTMLSFNVAVQDVQKNLQMLSDITGGNNDRFKMLALAFSQTSSAGRLMGQDLLQMINAGFNPLQQISKMTGESMLELKKRMEDGAISSEEVRLAMEAATAEGGMFHGMTERLAETMGGKLNIAFGQLEKSLAAVGQALAPLVIMMTDGFDKGQGGLNLMVKTIEKIADGIGLAAAMAKDLYNLSGNTEIDKFLDSVRQRGFERQMEAVRAAADMEFQNKKKVIEQVTAADIKAFEDAEKERLKAVKEWERAQKAAIKEAHREQLKAIEEAQRAQDAAAKAWQKELEDARSEAMKFFEEREKQNKKMREDASKGPGAGMELGSAAQIKFMADAANARIGAAAVPDKEVTNRDIVKKTTEMVVAQRAANEVQKMQLDVANRLLQEMQENGFRRIR
jgi:tape measure domain-containing protein